MNVFGLTIQYINLSYNKESYAKFNNKIKNEVFIWRDIEKCV